jgi:hypothetical protein
LFTIVRSDLECDCGAEAAGNAVKPCRPEEGKHFSVTTASLATQSFPAGRSFLGVEAVSSSLIQAEIGWLK